MVASQVPEKGRTRMKVTAKHACLTHNVQHEVEIPTEMVAGYKMWTEGKIPFVQDALPLLPAGEREILLTGTCQAAWDEMFADEECDEDCDASSHEGKMCR